MYPGSTALNVIELHGNAKDGQFSNVPSIPTVLRQGALHWPSVRSWTWSTMEALGHSLVLPVSTSVEERGTTCKTDMTLASLIASIRPSVTAPLDGDLVAAGFPVSTPPGNSIDAAPSGTTGALASLAETRPGTLPPPQPPTVPNAVPSSATDGASASGAHLRAQSSLPSTHPANLAFTDPRSATPVSSPSQPASHSAFLDTPRASSAIACPLYAKQQPVEVLPPGLGADLHFSSLFGWPGLLRSTETAFWVGDAGSITGLHNDDEHSLLVMLQGSKRVTLFPPSDEPYMGLSSKYDSGTNCCLLNPEDPDLAAFPGFVKATRYSVVLHPGDILFIPKFWFHHVRSITPSISVNSFVSNPFEDFTRGVWRRFLHALHNAGLYGSQEHCVCHSATPKYEAVGGVESVSAPVTSPDQSTEDTSSRFLLSTTRQSLQLLALTLPIGVVGALCWRRGASNLSKLSW